MSSFPLEEGCYELLTVTGKGFEDLMTVNLARYKPMGEYVTVRRINLEACSNELVTYLQGELHVSKIFSHPNILPYQATFIIDNELWVITSFMAYGSAKDLICTHFMDSMNELGIAYILQGVLKTLDYIHHVGYMHRSVKDSHLRSDLHRWEGLPVQFKQQPQHDQPWAAAACGPRLYQVQYQGSALVQPRGPPAESSGL